MSDRDTSELRFDALISLLERIIGHVDLLEQIRSYCAELLLQRERKSVEPMSTWIDPAHIRQRHQSTHYFIAEAPLDDHQLLCAVRQFALPIVGGLIS